MDELLFLAHRIPYPPNKGDKIRAYHMLEYLHKRYRVHLGCFVDDAADLEYAATLRSKCASSCLVSLTPARARLSSLRGFWRGEALSLAYYRHPAMAAWVGKTLAGHPISSALAFSTPMAQYLPSSLHRMLDMVDVDSEKWQAYAATQPWPLSILYRREAACLLHYEQQTAHEFDHVTFVSQAEMALFQRLTPDCSDKLSYFSNGTDFDYFSPQPVLGNPYPAAQIPIVFTGAMDYWPNIDAVLWFAKQILPSLLREFPGICFYIVGARPAQKVLALRHLSGVSVSGTVPDVRPYLQHAALVVAPLRIARGIQNKVLEAMAMQKAAVVTPQALEGISAVPGQEVLVADDEARFIAQIGKLLNDGGYARTMGISARRRILSDYCWNENLRQLGAVLQARRQTTGAAP